MKTSRRGIFSRVFRRTGFELQHGTANELLMRINRSLDPEPLTDRMWTAFIAARSERRAVEGDEGQNATGATTSELAGLAAFRHLPVHVVRDLVLMLRVETLLRLVSTPVPDVGTSAVQDVLLEIERELQTYVNESSSSDGPGRAIIDAVVHCAAKAAGVTA